MFVSKFKKAGVLFASGRLKPKFKGLRSEYYSLKKKMYNPKLGKYYWEEYEIELGDRPKCTCDFEGCYGAKKGFHCSHIITALLYSCLKPLLDKKIVKIMVHKSKDKYEELKLEDFPEA